MGKRQSWVSQRLKFGAFLNFITSGDIQPAVLSTLTERAFRCTLHEILAAFWAKIRVLPQCW